MPCGHLLGRGWPLGPFFVVLNCKFITFPLVSWVRGGTWLYRFLIFAPLITFICFTLNTLRQNWNTSFVQCTLPKACPFTPREQYIFRHDDTFSSTGPRSAVGNVSGYRCVSDCRSRSREFDPGPVPYFRGDWSWNNFYGHSPPFRWFIQEGLFVSYKRKYVHELLVNRLFKPAQEKVWLGELTVPQWP